MIATRAFPITLAFPPQGHFTQPYLALPCLKAWLKANGHDDVELCDYSVEAYDHFLTPEYLASAATRTPRLGDFENLPHIGFDDFDRFRSATESALCADAVIERINEAKACLRTKEFFDTERYLAAVRTIYRGLRLVSAAHHPSQLTPHNFTMGYANDRSREILAATLDERANPFLAFYRETVLPRLVARKPRVLGLSVIYGSQLIPALTLGRLVKEALPDCHITAGGGFLAYIGKKLMHAPGMEQCLDSVIFHEGEGPLLALCDQLRSGESDLSKVPSLTWFDRDGKTAKTIENPAGHPIKLDDAPAPDFDGLPLDKYFSPEIVIPYDINRGCYYGECTFCTLPTVIGPGFRTRSAETIGAHVVELRDRYATSRFNFITDCMPPGMIRDLPEELIKRRANITWWSDARVEPKAYSREGAERLYRSGCRKLLFGFETATPRLLKMMKKGQSLKSTIEVAENCAAADISVTFYAMVGFPSETLEEARDTLRFLTDHADAVNEVSLQTFHIDEVAQTYRDPESFGIKILSDPGADLALYHDYESELGMTQDEAAVAFGEIMDGLREHYPLFAGDNIYFFMQKSHYFLHLSHGRKPADFLAECRERTARLAATARVDADAELRTPPGLVHVTVPFSYTGTVRRLGEPRARAVRPDFLTGRFVKGAIDRAREELGTEEPRERVVFFDPQRSETVELTPSGTRLLDVLCAAGSLSEFFAQSSLAAGHPTRSRIETFAAELARLGLFERSCLEEQVTANAD